MNDGTIAGGVICGPGDGDICLSDGTSIFLEDQESFEYRVTQKILFSYAKDRGEITAAHFDPGYVDKHTMGNAHYVDYRGPNFSEPNVRLRADGRPDGRYFRNAWEEKGGKVVVNFAKARDIQMKHIRRWRDRELRRASGTHGQPVPEVEALFSDERKAWLQELRDMPQTFDLTVFKTEKTLREAWPANLPREEVVNA